MYTVFLSRKSAFPYIPAANGSQLGHGLSWDDEIIVQGAKNSSPAVKSSRGNNLRGNDYT